MRPVEPEAVFGQIKYDGRFRRFHYRGSKLTGAEFATIAIAHNIKKMISVMDAERAKAVAYEGRATRGTEAGADIRGLQQGVMEAGSKEVGDFAIWQNLRLF